MSSSSNAQTIDYIYREHYSWLRGWLLTRLGCSETAADLAQDTFFQILKANSAPEIRSPKPYLATLANRLAANMYRRRVIEHAYLQSLSSLPEDSAISPEEQQMVLETLIEIDVTLSQLPTKVREAFLLSKLDGLTYKQIAVRMSVTERTVKNYMAKAMLACLLAAGQKQGCEVEYHDGSN
ncbi:MAG: sigma-70 family RNA polymerase sigma factor [Pseudomonadota bacterium]